VLPSPLPLFPATNWWNLDISAAPVDLTATTTFINFIGPNDTVHPDFGGVDVEPNIYGFPYVVVNGSQLKKTVIFPDPDLEAESDGVGVPFYPIPVEAQTTPHWVEGGAPATVDERADSDRHLLIVDVDNKLLYELYNVWYDSVNARWEAGSGAFFDMKTNNRRPDGWTSADAAGLAILPGLARYEEAYLGSDPIRHALRMTVHGTNGYVYPASHQACGPCNPNAPPMGTRLRLKPGVNVASADPGVQRIVQAMKTYGLIVADNGSDMYVSGTFDTRWNNGILNPALDDLKASDFEVIQLGYGSNFADLSITKTDVQTTALPGSTVTYTITVTNNGPNGVTGATVADTFPAAITSATWTCSASPGSSCGGGGGSGNISRMVNLLPAGTVTFTVTATINAAATGTLSNTATVAIPGGMVDPTPGNNSATDSDTLIVLSPPTVTTQAATAIGAIGATLNASVNPNGSATSAVFDYGTTASYGSTTSPANLGSGSSPVATSSAISGLVCNTLYNFRARASNAAGSTNGGNLTFTTAACPARVFVSVLGTDTNDCSNIATPCRTLNAAIGQVATDGEVIVTRTGSYAGAAITKGVKIDAASGVVAFSGQPVTINAPGATVVIRGLTLKAVTPGTGTGLSISSAAAVFVENSVIDGWNFGIQQGTAELFVTDSALRNNGTGLLTSGTVAIDASRLMNNNTAILTDIAKVSVRGSTLSGNTIGVNAGDTSVVMVDKCEVANNGTGINVPMSSGSTVRVSRSVVSGNTLGLQNVGGTLEVDGTSVVRGNTTDTTGTISTVPRQ
jgi:uncharacterized repeat protein (TIGR01451 family)